MNNVALAADRLEQQDGKTVGGVAVIGSGPWRVSSVRHIQRMEPGQRIPGPDIDALDGHDLLDDGAQIAGICATPKNSRVPLAIWAS